MFVNGFLRADRVERFPRDAFSRGVVDFRGSAFDSPSGTTAGSPPSNSPGLDAPTTAPAAAPIGPATTLPITAPARVRSTRRRRLTTPSAFARFLVLTAGVGFAASRLVGGFLSGWGFDSMVLDMGSSFGF